MNSPPRFWRFYEIIQIIEYFPEAQLPLLQAPPLVSFSDIPTAPSPKAKVGSRCYKECPLFDAEQAPNFKYSEIETDCSVYSISSETLLANVGEVYKIREGLWIFDEISDISLVDSFLITLFPAEIRALKVRRKRECGRMRDCARACALRLPSSHAVSRPLTSNAYISARIEAIEKFPTTDLDRISRAFHFLRLIHLYNLV